MKIGILTQPLMNNYGGLLQNYALQTVLKEMGHEVYTLDRDVAKPAHLKCASIIKYSLHRLSGDKRRIRRWMTAKEKNIISQNTHPFIENYIQKTSKVTTTKELRKLHETYKFDVYIVGSDQVWRPQYSPCISNYFLDFIPVNDPAKRIAYAASFGVDDWEFTRKETSLAKSLIKKFDSISVREDSAVNLCKQYFLVDAIKTADPTLLLNREAYEQLITHNDIKQSDGNLFVYILDKNPQKEYFIQKIANTYGFKPFRVMPTVDFLSSRKHNIHDSIFPPVEKWIRGFMDADFVITDSFHGTIFSTIFNKPFFTLGNEERGSTRITSLLKMFSLEDRFITNMGKKLPNLSFTPDNYKNIKLQTEKIRKKSIDFLRKSIE